MIRVCFHLIKFHARQYRYLFRIGIDDIHMLNDTLIFILKYRDEMKFTGVEKKSIEFDL